MKKFIVLAFFCSCNLFSSQALLTAATNGNLEQVKAHLKEKANIDYLGENDKTPLMWAANNGHDAVVSFLLEQGADPNKQDEQNNTALFFAILNGHQEIAALLLGVSDCSLTNKKGQNALSFTINNINKFKDQPAWVKLLLKKKVFRIEDFIALAPVLKSDHRVLELQALIKENLIADLNLIFPAAIRDLTVGYWDIDGEIDECVLHAIALDEEKKVEALTEARPKESMGTRIKRSLKKKKK